MLNEDIRSQIRGKSRGEIYDYLLDLTARLSSEKGSIERKKKLYYISAEFLIGKLLSNNLINLGIYDEVARALKEEGIEMSEIEEIENEPSLGNGGLGRLAACFLDSLATLNYPAYGCGIRYKYGMFKQEIEEQDDGGRKQPAQSEWRIWQFRQQRIRQILRVIPVQFH